MWTVKWSIRIQNSTSRPESTHLSHLSQWARGMASLWCSCVFLGLYPWKLFPFPFRLHSRILLAGIYAQEDHNISSTSQLNCFFNKYLNIMISSVCLFHVRPWHPASSGIYSVKEDFRFCVWVQAESVSCFW